MALASEVAPRNVEMSEDMYMSIPMMSANIRRGRVNKEALVIPYQMNDFTVLRNFFSFDGERTFLCSLGACLDSELGV